MPSSIPKIRDNIHKKDYFKWALPVKLRHPPPPLLNGQGGPFSGRQKRRVIENQVQIYFDNENDDFCDENSNTVVDYGDEKNRQMS